MASNQVRKLKFDESPEGRERFFFVLQGYILGGSQPSQQRKNMVVVEFEAEILRKFLKHATQPRTENDMPQLVEAAEIALTETEYQKVKEYFDAAQWSTGVSIKVSDTWRWLLAIEPESAE